MILPYDANQAGWNFRKGHPQLGAERGDTGAGKLRYPLVTSIRDDSKQLFDTLASHRGYDSELGQMGAGWH